MAMMKSHTVLLLLLASVSISGCTSPADSGRLDQLAGSYIDIRAADVGELSSENTVPFLASTCIRIPVLMDNWLDEYVDPQDVGSADLERIEATYGDLDKELYEVVYLFDNASYTGSNAPRFVGEQNSEEPLVYRYGRALLDLKYLMGDTARENRQVLGVNGEIPEFMPPADVDSEMREFERVCTELVKVSDQ